MPRCGGARHLATVACLAEIRPLIPPGQRAWILVADPELQSLFNAGNLDAARQLRTEITFSDQASSTRARI